MPDSLSTLESQRAALLRQISNLDDMRPGSITGTGGRCGNPNCHCHRPEDPGHTPHPRLTYRRDGKTVTESFSSRPRNAKRNERSRLSANTKKRVARLSQ
jgi:uncharacterized protein DUF6788